MSISTFASPDMCPIILATRNLPPAGSIPPIRQRHPRATLILHHGHEDLSQAQEKFSSQASKGWILAETIKTKPGSGFHRLLLAPLAALHL